MKNVLNQGTITAECEDLFWLWPYLNSQKIPSKHSVVLFIEPDNFFVNAPLLLPRVYTCGCEAHFCGPTDYDGI